MIADPGDSTKGASGKVPVLRLTATLSTLVLLCLLFPLAAVAGTYSWEDENGMHFTDDVSRVPSRLRSTARQDVSAEADDHTDKVARKQKKERKTERKPKAATAPAASVATDRSHWKEWSRYVYFSPPPGYIPSDEPGNAGIDRGGIVFSPASSDSDDARITLAFMDGRLADPAIARKARRPTLTTEVLMDQSRREFAGKGKKASVAKGYLAGREAAVLSGKGEYSYAGQQHGYSMKRYVTICGIKIFEVSISAARDEKVQELDDYVQQLSLAPDTCNYDPNNFRRAY